MMSMESWSQRVAATLSVEPTELFQDGSRIVADIEPARWREAHRLARDNLQCIFFDWLSAVDEAEDGLRLVSHVWNVDDRCGILLRTLLSGDPSADSLVDVYPGASWHERETHEMFGIDFPGHANLSPLLLPPEFRGHPLRKSFVLASRVVKEWPGEVEPGGGRPSKAKPAEETEGQKRPRKRAPKRPLGVPSDPEWGKIVPPGSEAGKESTDD